MDFSFKNSEGKIQVIKLNMGDSWAEKAQDNEVLNSIFSRVDDGDSVIEENEVNLLKKLLEKADGLIKNLAGDKEISNEELQELDKQINNKNIKLDDIELEALQQIDRDYYTLEAIKQRYPEDKFEITEDYSGFSVKNKANDKEVLRVSQDKGEIYITENDENGKEKLFRNFDKDDELRFYDKARVRHNPVADMIYKSVSAKTSFGLGTTGADFFDNIMKISPKNVLDVAEYYKECYGQSLEDAINQEWGLDKSIKKQALEHFEKCLSEAYGFNENYVKENSVVDNKYYKGDSYSVKQQGNMIVVKKNNSASEQYNIDLSMLIENYSLPERAQLRAIIQNLPGEVLADIAIELETSFSRGGVGIHNLLSNIFGFEKWAGSYNSLNNSVEVPADEKLTIVHEVGHAVDFNGAQKNLSSIIDNESFKAIFAQEMESYLAKGNSRFNPYADEFKNSYFREGGGTYASIYATKNEQEMFAECYTLLMTGECSSRDLIEDFFPNTLQVIAKHLEWVRSLPANVRCAKFL